MLLIWIILFYVDFFEETSLWWVSKMMRRKLLLEGGGEVWEDAPPGICLEFNSLKSSFLDFWAIQTGYWSVPFSSDTVALHTGDYFTKINFHVVVNMEQFALSICRFQLGKIFFFYQKLFIMKNLTDFRKTVETGVDPRLLNDTRICSRLKWLLNVRFKRRTSHCQSKGPKPHTN